MAEEDPGYLQQEVLQNAGILPAPGMPAMPGGVPRRMSSRAEPQRPVSRQADPEAALRERQRREYEEAAMMDQMKQLERKEREAKEREAARL